MMWIITVIAALVALAAGFFIGKAISQNKAKIEEEQAKINAKRIIEEAKKEGESIVKDKQIEAKEKFFQKKADYDKFRQEKSRKLEDRERNIKQKEDQARNLMQEARRDKESAQQIKENLNQQLELVNIKKEEVDKSHRETIKRLEELSKLSAEEAREKMMEVIKEEARSKSLSVEKEIVDEARMTAKKEAKRIVLQTIQRTAAEHTIENCVSVFNLKSDDQKGQIIGREGRNIRALESATGVEIIVDDTPEAIIISGYNPINRETARLALQKLVADGRIHPARIEEVVAKTKKLLDEQILEIGERTVIEMGINGLHPELIKQVGRMRFRSSYGQNLLQHSREVANICATMAAELGLDVKKAKRAGLLHDIGKVPTEESELSHALLGMKWCEKYGEHPDVSNAVGAHHDEVEMTGLISPIVQACDAISGARPGARREIMESYIQRIKDLENLAKSYEGVQNAYAIQAGRELRVILSSDIADDKQADTLAYEMSQKIQDEMVYPGQIKITVIREKRAVGFAK